MEQKLDKARKRDVACQTNSRGRYGDFCVGELFHECCELKVKDSLLDQFEEGEYHGTVWISRIFLHQYIAYGKAVTGESNAA
jgi:hypothetical protein